MIKKIELQELLDYIKKRTEVNEMTVIHIYDYGKYGKSYTISIEPYEHSQIEYFQMDKTDENPYDYVFEALKEIDPSQTKLITGENIIYSYFVNLKIGKSVCVILNFFYEEGQQWMRKVYEENISK